MTETKRRSKVLFICVYHSWNSKSNYLQLNSLAHKCHIRNDLSHTYNVIVLNCCEV